MKRNHIHLATGEFGSVTSGVRANCEVYIYIDVERAMREGVTFMRSANCVILTEGFDGILPPHLVSRAVRVSDGSQLS